VHVIDNCPHEHSARRVTISVSLPIGSATEFTAWAGCPSTAKGYQSVPKVIGLPYPAARAWLTQTGFQPLLDWTRMQHDYALPSEEWIGQTGYFEVQACSDASTAACRAHFVDNYRNLLRIVADPYGSGSAVTDAFFVCGAEAATVFSAQTSD
jgi:hypothetical protein